MTAMTTDTTHPEQDIDSLAFGRTWREAYQLVPDAVVRSVQRLVDRGAPKDLGAFVIGQKYLWSELEALAGHHLSTVAHLRLLALYLYDVRICRWGDYVEARHASE